LERCALFCRQERERKLISSNWQQKQAVQALMPVWKMKLFVQSIPSVNLTNDIQSITRASDNVTEMCK
jgi:hypothetical protein